MSRLPIRPAALAAAAAGLSYAALRQRPPGGDATWSRTNHRGEPVTLLEGPAVAIGGMAGALAARGLTGRDRAAMLVAGSAAAALGGYDDLVGSGSSRGFRGHLGALRRGELTTGAVKLAGIGAAGLAAGALLGPADGDREGGGRRTLAAADLVINAGLVAGGANLLNLFDLRPGRAIKVALGSGGVLAATSERGRTAAAAPLGAAAALLAEDLGERAMLGDAGANALGALLGTAAATALPRPARAVTLAAVVGLTAASEVVSFTKVIERTAPLRWLDMLGRAPRPGPASRHRGGRAGQPGQRVRAARRGRGRHRGSGRGGRADSPGERPAPVTEPAPPVTPPIAPPITQDTPQRAARPRPAVGIGRAAALIAVLTICARLLGLTRQVVFAHTVQAYCLGTAYTTANQVPNIIYDIVLGGALTSVMVPVLARSARRAGTDPAAARQVTQTSSALLTWTVVILAPVSVIIAVAAGPIATLLNPANPAGPCGHASMITLTSRMITVFAPQVLCYGLAVALYGILQAHRRFTAPALAPVISSLVVMAAYLLFVPFGAGHRQHVAGLPVSAELILSGGTTLGVAALALTALVPAVALRLRLRPTLRFPAGVARQARGLAGYGIAALIAQDAALLVVIRLANASATQGAVVLYGYGWQVFESIYAVLAVPIVISAFPVLSGSDSSEFDETSAGSSRAVLLMSFLGAALLAAVATPAARVFAGHGQVLELALGFAAFAPGLIGYGLMACMSRVLLASGRNAIAAVAMVGGWLAVIVADVALVHLASPRWVVAALGLGNTVGFTITAVALVLAVRRVRGLAALRATARATVAGLAAGLAGAAAGAAVGVFATQGRPPPPIALDGVAAALAAACAAAVFGGVAYVLDGGELRAAIGRVRRTATR